MKEKLIENIFFFGLLGIVAYLVWLILFPFISALVLSIIIATIGQPLYDRLRSVFPKGNGALASFFATLIVFLIVVIPLLLLGYFMFVEAAAFYASVAGGQAETFGLPVATLENFVHQFLPDFNFDFTSFAQQAAGWLATSIGTFFASTATMFLMLLVAFIGLFYLFRDGKSLIQVLIYLSPLPDTADEKIVAHLGRAVRSVVMGRVLIAVVQGFLVTIGFFLFGLPQAALWGAVSAIASLIPAVGTSLILIPASIILFLSGAYLHAVLLLVWAFGVVGVADNILGPYLMGRGTSLHPFLVLISALGGISLFGPLGFILGPVTMSFFIALLEIYKTYIAKS